MQINQDLDCVLFVSIQIASVSCNPLDFTEFLNDIYVLSIKPGVWGGTIVVSENVCIICFKNMMLTVNRFIFLLQHVPLLYHKMVLRVAIH